MIGVVARKNEHIESMIKRFKKVCESSGIMQDMRRNEYYEKPSVKRQRKKNLKHRRST